MSVSIPRNFLNRIPIVYNEAELRKLYLTFLSIPRTHITSYLSIRLCPVELILPNNLNGNKLSHFIYKDQAGLLSDTLHHLYNILLIANKCSRLISTFFFSCKNTFLLHFYDTMKGITLSLKLEAMCSSTFSEMRYPFNLISPNVT